MGRQGRVVVALLSVLTVLAVLLAGGAIYLQVQERELRMTKERELFLAKTENEALDRDLREVRALKQQLEADLVRAKEQLDQTVQQLSEERTAKETLSKSVDERQKEIDRLAKDLEQARLERGTLNEQVNQLRKQQSSLQEQLAELEDAKSQLETKVLEFSENPSVQLGKVVVTNPPSASMTVTPPMPEAGAPNTSSYPYPQHPQQANASPVSAQEGQVVVVNREFNFIVMNLGRNQGLRIGQEFEIVRDQQVLGRAKIEKIYDELSAAAILPDSNKDAIREGDLVKAL